MEFIIGLWSIGLRDSDDYGLCGSRLLRGCAVPGILASVVLAHEASVSRALFFGVRSPWFCPPTSGFGMLIFGPRASGVVR